MDAAAPVVAPSEVVPSGMNDPLGPTNTLAAAASAVQSIAIRPIETATIGYGAAGRKINDPEALEEKKQKRMRRNRESAAQSRNRKKQYVEKLEGDVRQLKAQVNQLSELNYHLRREHARVLGQPPPEQPPLPYADVGTDPNAVHDDDSPVYVGDEETAAAEAVAELAAPSGFNHMNHQHRQHYAHNGDGGVAHVAHPTSAM